MVFLFTGREQLTCCPSAESPQTRRQENVSLSKPFLSSFYHHHKATGEWRFSARTVQNQRNHIISWASHETGNHRSPRFLLSYIHLREHQVWSCVNIVYTNNDNSILSLVEEHGILFPGWMFTCALSLWDEIRLCVSDGHLDRDHSLWNRFYSVHKTT